MVIDAPEGEIGSLRDAGEAIDECRRCPLYQFATQAVFGEGPAHAPMMVVGEQPGDQEDLQGRPFVGPSGRVFDQAADEAGIDRRKVYVTNAVKHFKFTPRGKKRLHQRPNAGEIRACRFWLDLERQFVHPKVIVAMGATAIHGVLGKSASIRSLRGEPLRLPEGEWLVATIHPSYLLRMPDRDAIEAQRRQFVADLASAKALVEKASAA
jgi:DNA polymerase